jgi:hypothetical protein
MTVYVDNARIEATVGKYKAYWSHLTTDDPTGEELHALARRIGLLRIWFQEPKHSLPHYDVTDGKRAQAIRAGAVPITLHEASELYGKLMAERTHNRKNRPTKVEAEDK